MPERYNILDMLHTHVKMHPEDVRALRALYHLDTRWGPQSALESYCKDHLTAQLSPHVCHNAHA